MTLAEYLDAAGLTPAAFARELGVSRAALSRYLSGARRPRAAIAQRIAELTGGAVLFGPAGPLVGAALPARPAEEAQPSVDLLLFDLNGRPRGKRVPATQFGRIAAEGAHLPASLYGLDAGGGDVPAAGLAGTVGDPDRPAFPLHDPPLPQTWRPKDCGLALMQMREEDGSPYAGDPRSVLQRQEAALAALGYRAVCACELEFAIVARERDAWGRPQPVLRPDGEPSAPGASADPRVFDMRDLAGWDGLLAGIDAACRAMDIPVAETMMEYGPGQFEINLRHVEGAVAAADQAMLFKTCVEGVAAAAGLQATFMAKPFAARPGNGLHVHLSLIDRDGGNVFRLDDGRPAGELLHALGGLIAAMPESMALFAPNANSYRRLDPYWYGATRANWGLDNRTAALRVPASALEATRIEHRVSGADANPYLVLAALLASVRAGLERGLRPPPAAEGNAPTLDGPAGGEPLPLDWASALDAFETGGLLRPALGDPFAGLFLAVKREEEVSFRREITPLEYRWYL